MVLTIVCWNKQPYHSSISRPKDNTTTVTTTILYTTITLHLFFTDKCSSSKFSSNQFWIQRMIYKVYKAYKFIIFQKSSFRFWINSQNKIIYHRDHIRVRGIWSLILHIQRLDLNLYEYLEVCAKQNSPHSTIFCFDHCKFI